jgi:hypothetical protein
MKIFAYALMTMVMVVALIGAYAMTAEASEAEQLRNLYSNYIIESISKSHSKSGLVKSKSENLKESGALARQKAIFLTVNHDKLVDEMVEKEVGTKPYQIDYFLNKRFHESNNLVSSAASTSSNQ